MGARADGSPACRPSKSPVGVCEPSGSSAFLHASSNGDAPCTELVSGRPAPARYQPAGYWRSAPGWHCCRAGQNLNRNQAVGEGCRGNRKAKSARCERPPIVRWQLAICDGCQGIALRCACCRLGPPRKVDVSADPAPVAKGVVTAPGGRRRQRPPHRPCA